MIEHAPAPSPRSAAAVTVRDFKAEDMDAVMAVMEAAFDSTYGEAWTRSQCAGILPMAGVALRIADHGDRRVAGFALLRAIADEAELLLIAVAPDAQHRGVGAALVEDFVAFSTARGARRLHLEVRDGNNAIALYERAGFSLAGRRREYYRGRDGHKRDALTLAFSL